VVPITTFYGELKIFDEKRIKGDSRGLESKVPW
jgi:hypothetical protein